MGIFDFFFKKKTNDKGSDTTVDAPDATQPQDDDGSRGKPSGLAPLQPIQIEKQSRDMFFNVLASVIKAYGEGFIDDKRFISTMADYGAFSQDFRYKAILKAIISEGYIVRITTTTIAKSQYDSIFMPFIKEHSFGKDETYYVVENLSRAFNKFNSAPNTGTNPSGKDILPRIIPDEFKSIAYKDLSSLEREKEREGETELTSALNLNYTIIQLYERLYLDVREFMYLIDFRNQIIKRDPFAYQTQDLFKITDIEYGIKHESYVEHPNGINNLSHPQRRNRANFYVNFKSNQSLEHRIDLYLIGIDKFGNVVYFNRKVNYGKLQFKPGTSFMPNQIFIKECELFQYELNEYSVPNIEKFILFPTPLSSDVPKDNKFKITTNKYHDIKYLFDIKDFMWDIFKYIQILAVGNDVYYFYIIDTTKILNDQALYELEGLQQFPNMIKLHLYSKNGDEFESINTIIDEKIHKAYIPFTPLYAPDYKFPRHIRKLNFGTFKLPVDVSKISRIVPQTISGYTLRYI